MCASNKFAVLYGIVAKSLTKLSNGSPQIVTSNMLVYVNHRGGSKLGGRASRGSTILLVVSYSPCPYVELSLNRTLNPIFAPVMCVGKHVSCFGQKPLPNECNMLSKLNHHIPTGHQRSLLSCLTGLRILTKTTLIYSIYTCL